MSYKINKESYELALVIGHLYGDGGITNNGRVHYCNSEEFLIKEFVDSMDKVFEVKPWIKKEQNIIRVKYPVGIGKELWNAFDKFSYGKDTKIITRKIRNMPLKWKVKMLQAWFNDDGSVINLPPNYKVVSIKQKLKHLIFFINEILREFEINSQIMEDDGKWLLRICGYENLMKFRDNINFSMRYRKRIKLNQMINSIRHPHFIIKDKILKLLRGYPRTRKELSKSLKLELGTIYGHLHGWKRKIRKSNPGLIDLGLVKIKKRGRINIYFLSSENPSPMWGWSASGNTASSGGSC